MPELELMSVDNFIKDKVWRIKICRFWFDMINEWMNQKIIKILGIKKSWKISNINKFLEKILG